MNVSLWIVQGVLALIFTMSGAMKLFAYETLNRRMTADGRGGISRELATFIGITEIAGAVGLIVPMVTRIAPLLTPWATVGLATIMVLATGFHVQRRESPVATIVLFMLAVFVGWGRFSG